MSWASIPAPALSLPNIPVTELELIASEMLMFARPWRDLPEASRTAATVVASG